MKFIKNYGTMNGFLFLNQKPLQTVSVINNMQRVSGLSINSSPNTLTSNWYLRNDFALNFEGITFLILLNKFNN